jgi:hypothetical protein
MNLVRSAIFALGLCCYGSVLSEEHSSYKNKTELMFPLFGESIITGGGRTMSQNRNHIIGIPAEKYAIDVAGLKSKTAPLSQSEIDSYKNNGLTIAYEGHAAKNENHYCFGRSVVAPAMGKIVSIGRGVRDNDPGVINNKNPRGNYVMIDHGNNEVSLLLHLRFQSIPFYFYEGMLIMKGTKLGECGNSGRSRGPHLHYQLQNSTKFVVSHGLPVQFSDLVVNDKLYSKSELKQGDIVRHREENAKNRLSP